MGRRPTTIPRPSAEKADGEDEEEMVGGIGWSQASQFGIIAASRAIRAIFIAEYLEWSLPQRETESQFLEKEAGAERRGQKGWSTL
jgi:hypothetical protein